MANYEKLRPWTDIERCECTDVSRILLVYTLTDNPVHCHECKGELDPERLKLTSNQVDQIASWLSVFSALYDLRLNSGEYEVWAKSSYWRRKGRSISCLVLWNYQKSGLPITGGFMMKVILSLHAVLSTVSARAVEKDSSEYGWFYAFY
jgi:hypothetical protein